MVVKHGTKLTQPTLEKEGYYFSCFKADGVDFNFNNPVTKNLVLEAFYIPSESTQYKIEFYYENVLDDGYTQDGSSTYYGTTDALTPIHEFSIRTGFECINLNQQETINADGSTVVKYYFKRKLNEIVYELDNGESIDPIKFKYGTPYRYIIPNYTKEGYSISYYSYYFGYMNDDYYLDNSTIRGDDTLRLDFTAKPTTFTVEYYFENLLDDEFTKDETRTTVLDSYTDNETYITEDYFDGFILYDEASTTEGIVKYDGSTTLKLYFKRELYTISYKTYDDSIVIPTQKYKYGTKLADPNISKVGYTLNYWRDNYNGGIWDFNNDIVRYDVELQADWTANTIKTAVEVYYENIVDDDYSLVSTDYVDTTVDTEYSLSYRTPSGFYINENTITNAYIKADGSTVFKLYFNRYKYEVTIHDYDEFGNWETIEDVVVKYGTFIKEPEVSRPGYDLVNWNYDFSKPVDRNYNIYPNYEARTDTRFEINVYIEDVDGNGWELDETFTSYGTTDTYFSETDYYQNNMDRENLTLYDFNDQRINGDGSTVIDIYYSRPQFNIIIHCDNHVTTDLGTYYNYGKELELIPIFDGDLAYEFIGIYDADDNYLGNTLSFTVTENRELYLKTQVKEELSIFNYNSSSTYLQITGFEEGCDVEDLVIPDYVTDIGGDAFYGNETIKTITFGENVKNISYRSFQNVKNLTSIYFNDKVEEIGSSAFENEELRNVSINTFPSNLKLISQNAFYNTVLDKIEFESNSNLETIESYAFSYDSSFENNKLYESITIPNSVLEIGSNAFYNVKFNELHFEANSSLEYIYSNAFAREDFSDNVVTIDRFPSSLIEIGYSAFYNTVLDKIEFESNSNLESIRESAFSHNSEFENTVVYDTITIPNSVTKIYNYAFYYLHINNICFEENSNLEVIGNSAFRSKEIESSNIDPIPSSVEKIENYAFYNRILDRIEFEENSNLELISEYAFSYNTEYENNKVYESITIPSSVKEIGNYSFYSVHFNNLYFEENSNLESIYSGAFALSEKDNILIPEITLPASLQNMSSDVFADRTFDEFKFEDGFNMDLNFYALQNTFINKFYYIDGVSNTSGYGLYYSHINELIIPNTVETISENLFSCAQIKVVTFEENSNLKKIENHAFDSCYIESITLPETLKEIGDYAFAWCHLRSLELPDNVEKVGDYAFYCNSYLKILIIGKSLYEIGDNAFDTTLDYVFNKSILRLAEGEADYGLVSIDSNTYLFQADDAYNAEVRDGFVIYHTSDTEISLLKYIGTDKQVTIPAYITYIEDKAFYENDTIEDVTITNHVTYIGKYAFYSCNNLQNVTIGNSVNTIDECAFQYCYSLRTVTISDSVETINQYAFNSCQKLTTLILGENVTTINGYAFSECYSLVEIHNKSALDLVAGNTSNGYVSYYAKRIVTEADFESLVSFEDDFARFDFNDEVYLLYYYGETDDVDQLIIPDYFTIIGRNAFQYAQFSSIVLGENIKELEEYAFYYSYYYLNEIIFNDKLEIIGEYALAQCYNLKNIVLPDSVRIIGEEAFYNISELNITVGSGLTTIGDYAFQYSLKEFNFSGENNIETIGRGAFSGCGIVSFELGQNLQSIGDDAFSGTHIYEIKNDSSLTITIGSHDYGEIALYCINLYDFNSGESIITYENGFKYITKAADDVVLLAYYGPTGGDVDLVIPENITSIAEQVFQGMIFGNITISKNVVNIYGHAFESVYCSTLTFEEDSKLEFIDDYAFHAIVFEQDELRFPSGLKEIGIYNFGSTLLVKRIYFPASIESIGYQSFWNLTELYQVVFEEGSQIEEISECVFGAAGYDDTLYVVIPKSVTYIYSNAMYDEDEKACYLYYGTATEWESVTNENDPTTYEVYYYSETEPEDEGNYWHFDENNDPVLW